MTTPDIRDPWMQNGTGGHGSQPLTHRKGEEIQTLGGIAVADPRHVAEFRSIPRPPNGCEEVPATLSPLLEDLAEHLVDTPLVRA